MLNPAQTCILEWFILMYHNIVTSKAVLDILIVTGFLESGKLQIIICFHFTNSLFLREINY